MTILINNYYMIFNVYYLKHALSAPPYFLGGFYTIIIYFFN